MGGVKHRAYLNYLYGITVEEVLPLAVEEDVCKEQGAVCREDYLQREAYQRIYGAELTTLLRCFRDDKGYPHPPSITLSEQKEFTYWLFKHRLQQSDKAKVASDTKKAVEFLRRHRMAKGC